jgi:hypothetical protein
MLAHFLEVAVLLGGFAAAVKDHQADQNGNTDADQHDNHSDRNLVACDQKQHFVDVLEMVLLVERRESEKEAG